VRIDGGMRDVNFELTLTHAARNVTRLTDHPGFRMRIGDWRVLYLLIDEHVVIQVIRIAPRSRAYR
jgi:mRNA interferase RelE/StbE